MPRKRSAIHLHQKLTVKESAFVDAICEGQSIAGAFRSAGGTDRNRALALSKKPEIVEAVERRRADMRRKAAIARDDVIQGLKEAIHDAKLLSDPQAQIAGWREIGKMLGYYEPEKKVVELSDKREEALAQLQALDMEQLMDMAGGEVIDGEFELM